MIWILAGACAIAAVPAGLRWLRVAQREHYLPGEVTRFARRWWYETGLLNRVIYMLAFAGVIVSITAGPLPGLLVAAAQVGPVGLSVRGKTSSLAWTPRLIRLASAWTLRVDGHLVLYFHPWEFADLSAYGLPRYVRRVDGPRLGRRLAGYLRWLSGRATFVTMTQLERARRPRA